MTLRKEDSQLADRNDNPLIGERQPALSAVKDDYVAGDLETASELDSAKVAAALNAIATAVGSGVPAVLIAHGLVEG